MQEDHHRAFDREYYSCNSYTDVGAHFPKSTLHFADQRHSQWPAILRGFYVFTDIFTIFARQAFKPFTYRFIPFFGFVEYYVEDWLVIVFFDHKRSVP